MLEPWAATPALFLLLTAAAVCDLRWRLVPTWLTYGGVLTGLLSSAAAGWDVFLLSLAGALAGGLVMLPFVIRGGFGPADAYLLAAVGAWWGWRLVLWTAWWTALAGAVLALIAYRRGQRTLAYVPAIAFGAVLRCVLS